jgi:hypothetical protein
LAGHEQRYYHALGRGCDELLRCNECRTLVLGADLKHHGCCNHCGSRRVVEVTTLSEDEMASIQSGLLDFPYREQFLAEFSAVPERAAV